ncbi:PQQ-binding-like beta-propeller repeat protein [Microbulbifer variabilis]|uniref:outer membrane protein assembly factor BamB family protein n=1 Tax=Microbulbifer variabilis TaxID=266805 RepID=UPI001CFD9FC4|nr:PQQ-binding-like beta-propeller repeat protein [Microbulbifer variabilis]
MMLRARISGTKLLLLSVRSLLGVGKILRCLSIFFVFLFASFSKVHAKELRVYEHQIIADSQELKNEQYSFEVPIAGNYELTVYRDGATHHLGQSPSGSIEVNNVEVLSWEKDDPRNMIKIGTVPLLKENTIELGISAYENAMYIVQFELVDSIAPTIEASVNPIANDYGWNNTPVTVSFSCADDIGVQSCSESIIVAEDGDNQVIVGTAADYVGNTSSTEVTINLDTAVPAIDKTIIPSANSKGWHNTDVTLSFDCTDQLSGVDKCNEQIHVTSEGDSQIYNAVARDKAGNETVSTSILSIDKTPPSISSQASAQINEAGWYRSPVTFTYSCQDNLSGVVSCPEEETVLADGQGQVISVVIEDKAGNTTQWNNIVNVDQTAPEVAFVSPSSDALLTNVLPQVRLLLSDNLGLDESSLEVLVNGVSISGCELDGETALCNLVSPLPTSTAVPIQAKILDLAGNEQQVAITVSVDTDGDSIADYLDLCSDTPINEESNSNGCALSQLDSDSDGVSDSEELKVGTDPNDDTSYPQIVINQFEASPSSVNEIGQKIELRWQVQGAESISLKTNTGVEPIDNLPESGSLEFSLSLNTQFILTASGPAGEQSKSVDVTIDTKSPPVLWESDVRPIQDEIISSLSVDNNGNSYVGAFDNKFYKISASGQVIWEIKEIGVVIGKASILNNKILVGSNRGGGKGMIYALSSDSTILWTHETSGAVIAPPLVSDDKSCVYVATLAGGIYSLDINSGDLLWSATLPNKPEVVSQPVIINEKLILYTTDGVLFALEMSTGTPSFSFGNSDLGSRVLWHKALK